MSFNIFLIEGWDIYKIRLKLQLLSLILGTIKTYIIEDIVIILINLLVTIFTVLLHTLLCIYKFVNFITAAIDYVRSNSIYNKV